MRFYIKEIHVRCVEQKTIGARDCEMHTGCTSYKSIDVNTVSVARVAGKATSIVESHGRRDMGVLCEGA